MHSIQTKFAVMIVTALLTLSLCIGGYATIKVNRIARQDSTRMLNAACNEQSLRIDSKLLCVEQAVTTIYNYARNEMPDIESLMDLEVCDRYLDTVKLMALDVSEVTIGARSCYFRINPDITGPMQGIYLVRSDEKSEFYNHKVTDVRAYEKDDIENVGWYYQPLEAGKPIWMSPYYNGNIGIVTISYVIPFFYKGTFVGVVGMDVDFTELVDIAQEGAIYSNSHANLIDMDINKIYYRSEDGNVYDDDITEYLKDILNERKSSEDELVEFKSVDLKTKYEMAYQTTLNGMRYMVLVEAKEINDERNKMVHGIVIMAIGTLGIFIFITAIMTRKITRPLRELTEATQKLAEGDWNVEIKCNTNDEVKVLTNGIIKMADEIREYVSEVKSRAQKDGLTGVKNINCYNDYISMMNSADITEHQEYAVVSFDVNNLKVINDNYGHLAGDALIKTACMHICKTFTHSPVFRTGGDEFVAILEGDDYINRDALITKFTEGMTKLRLPVEPYSAIQIACGMEIRSDKNRTYKDVFEKADAKMYENKRKLKMASN